MSDLPEVAERDATGTVVEAYEDIRRVVGLPVVNLISRHLAATPGLLESVWADLRPTLLAAGEPPLPAVAPLEPIPPAALAAAGVSEAELALAGATLEGYRRANGMSKQTRTQLEALRAECKGLEAGAALVAVEAALATET